MFRKPAKPKIRKALRQQMEAMFDSVWSLQDRTGRERSALFRCVNNAPSWTRVE